MGTDVIKAYFLLKHECNTFGKNKICAQSFNLVQ